MQKYQWKWAVTEDLSKLLGTLFDLHMRLWNVDQFLVGVVKAKLNSWSSTHLSLVGITYIMNNMLMSSLWYFIVIWIGLKKGFKEVQSFVTHLYAVWIRKHNTCMSELKRLHHAEENWSPRSYFPRECYDKLMSKWII